MNGAQPKIEIFKPFGEAYELMKKILFQPFDFKKWCVIGFAAFLTYLSGGGFPGLHLPGNWGDHVERNHKEFRSVFADLDPIWWVLIGFAILVVLAIFVVLTWVRARGHFIFIDCIVHNRAAIAKPWNEYRVEGNSYFVFSLLVTLVIIGLVISLALLIIVPAIWLSGHERHSLVVIPVLVLIGIFLVAVSVFLGTVIGFVAPVMYRRRCSAWPAFQDLLRLLGQHLGAFILYFLFSVVLGIAAMLVVFMVTCATCCLAAIPYVGTVILLPVFVLIQSFALFFLRQFGPDYDVWAGIETATPVPPPIQIPPPPAQT
jgi:hypothetical protein